MENVPQNNKTTHSFEISNKKAEKSLRFYRNVRIDSKDERIEENFQNELNRIRESYQHQSKASLTDAKITLSDFGKTNYFINTYRVPFEIEMFFFSLSTGCHRNCHHANPRLLWGIYDGQLYG